MSIIKYFIHFFLLTSSLNLFTAPIITSVNPSQGDVIGGTAVSITGSGFTGASNVNFGTRPATSFLVANDNSITAIAPAGTAGTVDIAITVSAAMSAPSRADFYTYTQNSWRGILSSINLDEVTLFDTSSNSISTVIPVFADSPAAVITPDGMRIYTADSDQPSVTVIDVATSTTIATIITSVGTGAFDIIVSPDGSRVYVSNNISGYVTVIDTLTNTVVTDIFIDVNLGPLSITPDGTTVYVSNFSNGTITAIDTATNTVGVSIPVGIVPGMISITPDGTKAYVCNLFSDSVSVVDIATNTVINTINLATGAGPYGSSIIPNGATLYVANINNDTVTVIDVATDAFITTLSLTAFSQPFWAACTPDSKTVYVINQNTDDVTPIDVATNTLGSSFANLPGEIQDIVMAPDQAPVASFVVSLSSAGYPSVFDASASISPIGTIATYAWDFGDGNMVTTTSAIINHTYISTGTFNAVLTVTNSAGTSTAQIFSSRFMSNNGGLTATVSHIISSAPSAPTNLTGFQMKCKKTCKSKYTNVITWTAPTQGEAPVAYRIYRDAALTHLKATVSSMSTLKFVDRNRKKNVAYTYYIVSVSALGNVSAPASITIQPL